MDKYVVAFIDLLGSKRKIESDANDVYFRTIRSLYDNVVSMFPKLDGAAIKSKIFSDNIIFARKITDEAENKVVNLHQMTCIAAIFQLMAILHANTMVRGGIALGEFFIDEIMVWGKGLVEAYSLESDNSHTSPTIILSDNAKDIAKSNPDRLMMINQLDGSNVFVDYLRLKGETREDNAMFGLHRHAVLKIFNEIRIDALQNGNVVKDSIKAKRDYLGGYHNLKCKEMGVPSLSIDADNWVQQFNDIDRIIADSGNIHAYFKFIIPEGRSN